MANLNKVFLIGRLTQDPELRYTPGGAAVANLPLAVSRFYQTKDGETKEESLFIDVTVWNRQAENCCQFLKKGAHAHVEGFIKMDTWDDKTSGEKRSKLKVEADRVQFLDSRERSGSGEGDSSVGGAPPRRSAPSESRGSAGSSPSRSFPQPSSPPTRRPAPPVDSSSMEEDEDIPF